MVTCGACGGEGHRRNSPNCPLYALYDQSKTKSKKNPQWKDSDARAQLKSMLVVDRDGEYLHMTAENLQKLSPAFGVYQKGKFKEYVITLKNEVMKEKKNWPDPWGKSEAKEHAKSLLLDDPDGTYQAMELEEFWNLSPLFQQYPLEYFVKYADTF